MQAGTGGGQREQELARVGAPLGAALVVTDRGVRLVGRAGNVLTWLPREQISQVTARIVAPGVFGFGRRMQIVVKGQGTAVLSTTVKPGREAQAVLAALGQ